MKVSRRIDVTGQHHDLIHRTDRHDAGEETRFGSLRELRPLVVDIDERPPPNVGHASHHLHRRLCHRSGCGTRNFRGGLRNRDLLRLSVSTSINIEGMMAIAQAVHMRCFNPGFIWWLSIAVGDRVAIYRQDAGAPCSVSGLPLPPISALFLRRCRLCRMACW